MKIGLINGLNGRPDTDPPAPTWASIKDRALLAESIGFDMFVYEDALLYRGKEHTNGVWESMTMSGAIAEATSTIRFGQSVVNSPYRSPAMVVSMAEALNEISGGRYVLGIGAGNTADSDYEAFGFPTDHRYSRFAEAIEIIHSLSRTGRANFEGAYYSVKDSEIVLRGTDGTGPFINIAAGGEKMMTLVARFADAWNWWSWDLTAEGIAGHLAGPIGLLEAACEEVGRDPGSVVRTLDLYSVTPPGFEAPDDRTNAVFDSAEAIAEHILSTATSGIAEVRLDLTDTTLGAIEAMAPVVDLVHAG